MGPLRSIQTISPRLQYLQAMISYSSGLSPYLFPSTSFHISIFFLPICEIWLSLMELCITFITFSLSFSHRFRTFFCAQQFSVVCPWRQHWGQCLSLPPSLPPCLNTSVGSCQASWGAVGLCPYQESCSRRLEAEIWTRLYFHSLLVQKEKGIFFWFCQQQSILLMLQVRHCLV